jgi:hypothetical protein
LVVFFFVGLVPFAGFVPPPDPRGSPTEIQALYTDHLTSVRVGLLISTVSVSLFFPWGAAIAVLTRRSESTFPVFTYMQVACVAMAGIVAMFCCMLWSWAAFRPDEIAPETTRAINDLGWFLFLYTWPPFSIWALAIAGAIFCDRSERPVFPRWAAYLNVWVAILLVPAGAMLFFKHGAFAFNGVITFWIPTIAFFIWMPAMSWLILKAVADDEAAARDGASVARRENPGDHRVQTEVEVGAGGP